MSRCRHCSKASGSQACLRKKRRDMDVLIHILLIRGRQDGENSREDPGTRERAGEPGMQAARCD